jgi:hypothetical protein
MGEELSGREESDEKCKEGIRFYAEHLGLDNEYMIERMLEVFNAIYGQRKNIRKTVEKQNIAIAYAVYKVMCDENIPRPPQYVTSLFDRNNLKQKNRMTGKKLLNAPEFVSIGSSGVNRAARRRKCRQEISGKHGNLPFITALHYVGTLCDHLQIDYRIATAVKKRVRGVMWKKSLSIIRPQGLVVAVLLMTLAESKDLHVNIKLSDILDQVSCTRQYVKDVVSNIFPFKKLWSEESNVNLPLPEFTYT